MRSCSCNGPWLRCSERCGSLLSMRAILIGLLLTTVAAAGLSAACGATDLNAANTADASCPAKRGEHCVIAKPPNCLCDDGLVCLTDHGGLGDGICVDHLERAADGGDVYCRTSSDCSPGAACSTPRDTCTCGNDAASCPECSARCYFL